MPFPRHFYNTSTFLYKHLDVCKVCGNIFIHNKLSYNSNRYLSLSAYLTQSTVPSSECAEKKKKPPKLPNPMFEKFDKMFNELSVKQGNDIEFPTNFGSIRFDSDVNITSVFNSFENVNAVYENNETNNNESNFVDDVYFNNSVSNIDQSHAVDEGNVKKTFNELRDPDLNYIDDQYLKAGTLGKTKTSTNYNSESRPDISSLNYVDSQIQGLPNEGSRNAELETAEKNELNSYFGFEDSLNETEEENFIFKVSKIENEDEYKRENLENRLFRLTEGGIKYFEDLDKAQKIHTPVQFKPEPKISEEKKEILDFNEQDLQPEIETEISETSHSNNIRSAYSYVMEKRKEEMISSKKEIKGEVLDHERYKKILLAVPTYSHHTTFDMAKVIRANILYDEDDIIAINKPYGIPVHGGGSKDHDRLNIVNLLPTLAELLRIEKLEPVHRIDMNVTGVMLLAKTDRMAEDLKKMFKEREIKKSYLAIVKGVPDTYNGIIDIPIGEGKVDRFERMVLRPDIPNFRGRSGKSKKALTRYKVLSTVQGAALLEVNPITGIKHQIRVHLGFGLNCPVIGDHKYSYLTKIAPQKLPGNVLHRLRMQQSKVRTLPMFLHSFRVTLPFVNEKGKEIYIRAVPPKHFRMTLQALKLSDRRNRLSDNYSELIYGWE